MHWRILLLLTFFTSVGDRALSQVPRIAEKEFYCARLYSKVVNLHYSDPDSAAIYSDRFEKEFQRLITSEPATFDHKFPKLIDSNFCFIQTSPDKKLKIYSWDTWLDSARHVFRTIYQWRDKGVTYSKLPPAKSDIAGFCSAIYNVFISGKSYYLVVTNAVFSDKHGAQTITAYPINNNTARQSRHFSHQR